MMRELLLTGTILLLALVSSAAAQGLDALIDGIKQANKNGAGCGPADKTCLGTAVTVTLTQNFKLQADLPSLSNGAHLIVVGSCATKDKRCIVDGDFKFRVFTFSGSPYGAPGLLELTDLTFQRARGVIRDLWATVKAERVVFRENTDTAIRQVGAFGGYPSQYYTNCRFMYNSGSAIYAGNGKLGLAQNGGIGFLVRRSIFFKNAGTNLTVVFGGGAVYLAGLGTSIFQNTKFVQNTSPLYGGAVYGEQTTIKFQGVTFAQNFAELGGGAVAGSTGFYRNSSTSFCTSKFDGNSSNNQTATTLLFLTYNPGYRNDVHFCDTPVPPGSVFVAPSAGDLTTGTGKQCYSQYCSAQ